jgi:adenylate cyclase
MIRRARLWSGLVMFAYVLTHLGNHAVGLVSVAAMDRVKHELYLFWTAPVPTWLLYGSFAVHYCLALWALWQRRSLRMPAAEATQLVLGLAIPVMLADHVMLTRVGDRHFGGDFGYYVTLLQFYWIENRPRGVLQLAVLVVAWTHAMLGFRFWLRVKPWYPRWQPALFAFALLFPVLSLLGMVEGGLRVMEMAQDPAWVAEIARRHPRPNPENLARLEALTAALVRGFWASLALVLAARFARRLVQRRRGLVRLTYPSGRVVEIEPGLSVLEASRNAGIPHASVCGGRGRCTTCRIRVAGHAAAIPPPAPEETRVLERVGAAPDVRLACQLRPRGDLQVTPLLPATAQASDALGRPGYLLGMEREIAILFADLRAFTSLAERKLPYDVVFLLNRYFAEMGQAIEEAGGHIDKFIGDGIMALFGLDRGVEAGCREALAAAAAMAQRLERLNETLAHDLPAPLRIGIGIHVGHAIVGEMGYGRAVSLTAVGDAVNTASRLESMTKGYDAELIVSADVLRQAGLDPGAAAVQEIDIRGRVERLKVHIFRAAAAVATLARAEAVAAE